MGCKDMRCDYVFFLFNIYYKANRLHLKVARIHCNKFNLTILERTLICIDLHETLQNIF